MSRQPTPSQTATPIHALSGGTPKPIQIVQPLQSNTTTCMSSSDCPSPQPSCTASAVLHTATQPFSQPVVQPSVALMTSPVSGSLTPYMPTTAAATFTPVTFSMLPSLAQQPSLVARPQTTHVQQNSDSCRPKAGMMTPSYIYQGVPMGQQIVLTNPGTGGIFLAQPQNMASISSPYMIASNQQLQTAPQMVSIAPGQLMRGPMQLGTMAVVLPPAGNPAAATPTNFIQVPDHRFLQPGPPASSSPSLPGLTAGPSIMQTVAQTTSTTTSAAAHTTVASSHQPLHSPQPTCAVLTACQPTVVCSSPSPTVQQPVLSRYFSQVPPGMTLTRLPNGALALAPICQPTPPIVPPQVSRGGAPAVLYPQQQQPPPTPPQPQPPIAPTPAGGNSTSTPPTPSTAEVLRQLEVQIGELRRLPQPTAQQTSRIADLVKARDQLKAAVAAGVRVTRPAAPSAPPSNPRPRPALQPRPIVLSPAVRSEVMELLRQKNLYPIKTSCDMRNTVLVEFRLNNQGYKVHLTRAEKAQLESLLLSEPAQRQAEILIFYQQEQAALFAARFAEVAAAQSRACAPRSPSITCSSVTQMQPPAPPPLQASQAQPQLRSLTPSGVPLSVTGQPPRLQPPVTSTSLPIARPPNGAPTAVTVAAAAAAATPHSQPVHILQTRLASATPVGMCMLTRVHNPSAAGTAAAAAAAVLMSPQSANPAVRPTPVVSVSSASPTAAPSVIRPPALTVQQASRMTNLRSMLHSDHRRAVARPAITAADTQTCTEEGEQKKEERLPTPEELLELLLPYHTFQDLDNTPQAMEKVDTVLEKALNQLNKRKRQTESAVASIMYSEKWRRVDFDYADRLVVSKMALDLDQDIFTAEKAACESFLAALDREYPLSSSGLAENPCAATKPKSFRELLDSAQFEPLTFDETGNARPASIPSVEAAKEAEEKAIETRSSAVEAVTPATGDHDAAAAADAPTADAPSPSPLPNGEPSVGAPERTQSPSSPSSPPSLSDHRSETSSSTKQAQQQHQPQNGLRRGLASEDEEDEEPIADGEEEEEEEAMHFLIQSRATNSTAKYTDVAPDVRWPEWAPEEEDNCQELDMTSIAEDTVEEDEDGEESEDLCRGLKSTWAPCSFSLPNGVTDPSNARSRSCLSSRDQSTELQHSEDPDLDAAIRSIIG
ncbi:hypothetical protein SprV_0100473100 [Sparganum proliferum]